MKFTWRSTYLVETLPNLLDTEKNEINSSEKPLNKWIRISDFRITLVQYFRKNIDQFKLGIVLSMCRKYFRYSDCSVALGLPVDELDIVYSRS